MKVLFLGDIVSKLGRKAVVNLLPKIKKGDNVDLAVGNIDNLAGGRGATEDTVREVVNAGLDYCTSGDHTFDREEFKKQIEDLPVLRPANYPPDVPGKGFAVLDLGKERALLINLIGLSAGEGNIRCPFRTVDEILSQFREEVAVTLVDFHAENTSERRAMSFYLDGRVSALVGTHTHIPSADEQMLPKGTAYVTDLGMCGPKNSVLGVKPEIIIERYKYPYRQRFEWVKRGPAKLNSVLVEINKKGVATNIERVDRELN